jgi:hypothetical protein
LIPQCIYFELTLYAVLILQAAFTADKEGLLPMHYASDRDDKNLNLEVVQYILQTNPKGRAGSAEPPSEEPKDTNNAANASGKGKAAAGGGGFLSKAVSMFSSGKGGTTEAAKGNVRRKSVMQKHVS